MNDGKHVGVALMTPLLVSLMCDNIDSFLLYRCPWYRWLPPRPSIHWNPLQALKRPTSQTHRRSCHQKCKNNNICNHQHLHYQRHHHHHHHHHLHHRSENHHHHHHHHNHRHNHGHHHQQKQNQRQRRQQMFKIVSMILASGINEEHSQVTLTLGAWGALRLAAFPWPGLKSLEFRVPKP